MDTLGILHTQYFYFSGGAAKPQHGLILFLSIEIYLLSLYDTSATSDSGADGGVEASPWSHC